MSTFDAVIIGAGRIASGFGENDRDGPNVLTHAKAYTRHERFRLVACIDPDAEARQRLCALWGVERGYADLDAFVADGGRADVYSLCVPDILHAPLLDRLLTLGPRAVFAEKPLTDDLASASRLVHAYDQAGIMLPVNYLRRWDKAMEVLAGELRSGKLGPVQNAVVWYGKGLIHTASHFIDILEFLLGPLRVSGVGRELDRYLPADPTLDFELVTDSGAPIRFMAMDEGLYTMAEFSIATAEACIDVEQSGLRLRRRLVTGDPVFSGYRKLGPAVEQETGLLQAVGLAVDELAAALDGTQTLRSTGATALRSMIICQQVLDLASQERTRFQ